MSSNFICPEHALPWEFVTTNGEWSSSGGVDVACCAAGSTCEDSFEDPCTGTSMDFGGGMWAGLFVGILAFCILLSCIDALVKQIEKAALRSDAAVQCEGTLTAAPVESSGEGGSAHYLEWEFHVPSNCPRFVAAWQKYAQRAWRQGHGPAHGRCATPPGTRVRAAKNLYCALPAG